MGLLKKLFNKFVYKNTKKPEHYVHVDKPKSLQDYRQVQYNNWCKRKGVYCGAYLPKNPDTLTKKRKGWVETKGKPDGSIRNFTRKSTKQMIQFNDERIRRKDGVKEDKHYHWKNVDKNGKSIKRQERFDKYGKTCKDGSPESHLAPLDKDYIMK